MKSSKHTYLEDIGVDSWGAPPYNCCDNTGKLIFSGNRGGPVNIYGVDKFGIYCKHDLYNCNKLGNLLEAINSQWRTVNNRRFLIYLKDKNVIEILLRDHNKTTAIIDGIKFDVKIH